jgi:prepilin peptidase CpaA
MAGWIYAGIAVTALSSCAWDLWQRRIPNALTLASTGAAFALHAVDGGLTALLLAVAGWTVGVLLFLPWWALGGMGGGDVKLLGAFGAWVGPAIVFRAALFAMVAGGVIALVVAFAGGSLGASLSGAARLIRVPVGPAQDAVPLRKASIAYALPTAVGVGLALWLR